MQVIRRRIRSFFALQALLLFLAVVASLARPSRVSHSMSPLRHDGTLAAYLVLSLIFAQAWRTTRKPDKFRNVWAIAASIISLAAGLYFLWERHASLQAATPALLIAAIGVGGLYFFGQGGSPAKSASTTPAESITPPPTTRAPIRIAGDRTSPWVNRLVTAVSAVAEFAAIFLWARWAHLHHLPRRTVPWYLLFTFAVLLSTLLHECGHALVAWGFHMRLLSFNAGPIQWQKRDSAWKFKFNPAGFFDLGGAVRVVPTDPDQPRAHDLWMIAAGPLANLLFGSILLAAVLRADWPHYEQTWRLVAFTSSFCFIAAITNLLPFRIEQGGYSDGAQILQILTRSPLDDLRRTLNSLAAITLTPRRYRDLDVDAIERAAAHFPQEFTGLNLLLCAANCYLETDRLPQARAALASAQAISEDPGVEVPAAAIPAFVIDHAWLNRDAASARLWWDRLEANKPERLSVDYWIARAALLWIENLRTPANKEQVEEAWQKADAEAQARPESGAAEFDRYRCALLRKELDAPSLAPAASETRAAVAVSDPAAISLADRIAGSRRTSTPPPLEAAAIPDPTPSAPTLPLAPILVPSLPTPVPSIAERIAPSWRSASATPAEAPAAPILAPVLVQPTPTEAPPPEPVPVAAAETIVPVDFKVDPLPLQAEPIQLTPLEVAAIHNAPLEPLPFDPALAIPQPPSVVDRIAPSWRAASDISVPEAPPADVTAPTSLPLLPTLAASEPDPTPTIDWAALIAEAQAKDSREAEPEAPESPTPAIPPIAASAFTPQEESAPATPWAQTAEAAPSLSTQQEESAPTTPWAQIAEVAPSEAPAPASLPAPETTWSTVPDAAQPELPSEPSAPPLVFTPARSEPVGPPRHDPLKYLREGTLRQETKQLAG